MLNKYVYDSKISGPRLLLLGAVHGNETAGSKEILKLKEALDNKKICLKSGCLTLMPVCNPLAHAKGVRYVEKNLNRLIRLLCVLQRFIMYRLTFYLGVQVVGHWIYPG